MILNLEKVSLITCLVATVITVGGYIISMRNREQVFTTAYRKFKDTQRTQAIFYKQVALLEEHSSKYFTTLNEGGFSELLAIRTALLHLTQDVEFYIENGNMDAAHTIINYLDNPSMKPFPQLTALSKANLNHVFDWKMRGNELITACVIKLGIMASQPSIDKHQDDLRRKTLTSLEQLRQVLSIERSHFFS